jgi:hypothetical protein
VRFCVLQIRFLNWELFVRSLLLLFLQTAGVHLILVYRVNIHASGDPSETTLVFSALVSVAQVEACVIGAFGLSGSDGKLYRFDYTFPNSSCNDSDRAFYPFSFINDCAVGVFVELIRKPTNEFAYVVAP